MSGCDKALHEGDLEDDELEFRSYSSPACMMHEFDHISNSQPEGLPTTNPIHHWEEIRLWRKAKRATLIERRLAISSTERNAHSQVITAALRKVLPTEAGTLIGFYWPFKGEYDPRGVIRLLHAQKVRLALPVVVRKAEPLIFREWWPGITMASGLWNIPVPAAGEPVAPSLLLVPVVGFDRQNYRLGYGGGYYDRTLAAAGRPRTVGVGFEHSQIATIYPQPHDIPMDQVITERAIT
jgi:5-formyltetrahydrofolate cyclo-ligase